MTNQHEYAGTSIAHVDPRLPGGSTTPRTQYRSAGHKPLPAREVARRRMMEISADTGPVVFHRTEHNIQVVVRGMNDVDAHHAARAIAHGIAVGSWCRAADPYAGYLGSGSGVRLPGPQAQLRHLFGVSPR
jgi:hypothetical protein